MMQRWLLPITVILSVLVFGSLVWFNQAGPTVRAVSHPSQFYIDGKEVTAKDHQGFYYNGTKYVPATLEYEGTVYVPLRLVGSKLNKPIGWSEGKTSVWLGSAPSPVSTPPATPAKTVLEVNHSTPVPIVSAATPAQASEPVASLFGVSIGNSVQQVLATLGPPVRQEPSALGYVWYIYNKDLSHYLQVGIADGKAIDLYSNAPSATMANVTVGTSYESLTRKHPLKSIVSFAYAQAQIEVSNQLKQKPLALVGDTPAIFYLDQQNQNKVTAIRLLDRLRLIQGGFYETKWTYQGKSPNFDPPALTIKQQELVNAAHERQVLDLTNVIRTRNKLPLVRWNDYAARVARAHSDDMENNQFFDHVSATTGLNPFQRLQNAGLRYQMAGENIAAGYPDAIEAVENWMNSLGHRKNILEKGFTELGIGVIADYYTQDFVTPVK